MNAPELVAVAGIVDQAFCTRFSLALVHFLWQGALVGLLVLIAGWCLRRAEARLRYMVNVAAMLLMVVCLPVTFTLIPVPETRSLEHAVANETEAVIPLGAASTPVEGTPEFGLPSVDSSASEALGPEDEGVLSPAAGERTDAETAGSLLSWVASCATVAYLLGVSVMLLRLAIALWGGHRLKRCATPVDDQSLLALIADQAHRIGMKAAPAVAYCGRVAVPVVVGIVKPTILLPTSLATGLATDQLEAIFTHELAHIRRFDLLMNLLQRLIESLLFFHPAVWYVSRRVSIERENWCDDFVVSSGCERLQYAGALIRMAELCGRLGHVELAGQVATLAATGENPSQFKRRVMRLLGYTDRQTPRLTRAGLMIFVAAVTALAMAPLLMHARAHSSDTPSAETDDSTHASVPVEPLEEHTSRTGTADGDRGKLEQYELRVVDWRNRPVPNAEIEVFAVAYDGGSSSPSPRMEKKHVTDSAGVVVIDYPRVGGWSDLPVVRLGIRVSHPDFPAFSGYRGVNEYAAVVLPKPTWVSIQANRESDGRRVTDDLFAVTSGESSTWNTEAGLLKSGPLDIAGDRPANLLRAVHAPRGGPVLFSDLVDLSGVEQVNGRIRISVRLQPAARVEGRLSDDVPRPVRDGKILAAVIHGEDFFSAWRWYTEAEIHDDGTFVLDSLPGDEHLQLIALCRGWASDPPWPSEVTAYSKETGFSVTNNNGVTTGHVTPRLHRVTTGTSRVVIPMVRTAEVVVTVVDEDANPISEAKVGFAPNQIWFNGGSTILGVARNTTWYLHESGLPNDRRTDWMARHKETAQGFLTKTDANGIVRVSRLPAHRARTTVNGEDKEGFGLVGFSVTHPDYTLVPAEPRRVDSIPGPPMESVELTPGETSSVTAKMRRKDASSTAELGSGSLGKPATELRSSRSRRTLDKLWKRVLEVNAVWLDPRPRRLHYTLTAQTTDPENKSRFVNRVWIDGKKWRWEMEGTDRFIPDEPEEMNYTLVSTGDEEVYLRAPSQSMLDKPRPSRDIHHLRQGIRWHTAMHAVYRHGLPDDARIMETRTTDDGQVVVVEMDLNNRRSSVGLGLNHMFLGQATMPIGKVRVHIKTPEHVPLLEEFSDGRGNGIRIEYDPSFFAFGDQRAPKIMRRVGSVPTLRINRLVFEAHFRKVEGFWLLEKALNEKNGELNTEMRLSDVSREPIDPDLFKMQQETPKAVLESPPTDKRKTRAPSDDTRAEAKGRVLIIGDWRQEGRFGFLADCLRRNNLRVDVVRSDELFTTLAKITAFDVIVLADVPRTSRAISYRTTRISDTQIRLLAQAVEQYGCGLVMMAGPNGLTAGDWAGTELERALPIQFKRATPDDSPVARTPAVPVEPAKSGRHVILSGLDGPLPPLKGHAMTTPKDNPLVHVPVVSPGPNDQQTAPILATWSYGLGRAAVFTSHGGGPWAKSWGRRTGYQELRNRYERFLSQIVLWAMRAD